MHKAPGSGPASATAALWGARPEKPGGDARPGRGWVTGGPACVWVHANRGGGGPTNTSARLPPRGRLGNCRRQQRGGGWGLSASCCGTDHPAGRRSAPTPPYRQNTPDGNTDSTSVGQGQTNLQMRSASPGSETKKDAQRNTRSRHAAGETDRAPKADGQTDPQAASRLRRMAVGKVTYLYWLSLHPDQRQRQTQAGSGKRSWDGQVRRLQRCPRVLGGCGSSSTAPRVDRCPGGRTVGVNPGSVLSSLCWVPFLDGELARTPCPPRFSQPCCREGDPWVLLCGWWGCLTSLNLLQGKDLSRAARWTGSSAGSFLLFWCSLRLSSIASPAALPLCRQRSSWDPILPRAKPHRHPRSHSPWPGTGPGAPVGLRISLEALESSLAGAGVGIIPDGEVGLQPGDVGVGAEGQVPCRCARTTCQPPCSSTCLGKAVPARVGILIQLMNMYPVPTTSLRSAIGKADVPVRETMGQIRGE